MQYKKSVFRSLSLVTQLGLCVITPIFLCVFAGNYIDSRFGTKITVILLIVGTLSGGRAAYVLVKRMIETEEKEDRREKLEKEASSVPSVSKPKQPSRVRMTDERKDAFTDEEESDE